MAYTNPVPGGTFERVDMGVDISAPPGTPIRAIATEQAVGISPNWYKGQPFEWFRILGTNTYNYISEQITRLVSPGTIVRQGQPVAYVAGSGTGLELGWATASGRTLAAATTGYKEGQVTPAGSDYRSQVIQGGGSPALSWKPCLLTWYDPALGGTNSSSGKSEPHGATASGQPYDPAADTCAAPPQYAFGTMITFRYQGKTVVCKVTDRGGAIIGAHFDLSRHAAETLGIINRGAVNAQFAIGTGANASDPTTSADSGAGVDALFQDWEAEVNSPRVAPPNYTKPFTFWWSSFRGRWN